MGYRQRPLQSAHHGPYLALRLTLVRRGDSGAARDMLLFGKSPIFSRGDSGAARDML